MTTNINDFIGSFADIASPNKFRVTVTPPPAMTNLAVSTQMTFFCFKAILPGLVYGSYLQRSGNDLGNERPNDIINPKLTLGFYNVIQQSMSQEIGGVLAQTFWYDWSRLINPSTTSYEYHENFVGTIEVEQLDRAGEGIRTWRFLDCWPKELGDVQLDYGTMDQVQTFDVGLSYRTYEIK